MLWGWVALTVLMFLTIQDYLNHRKIDDRRNFFMTGLSFGLLYIFRHSWYYTLSVIVVAVVLKIIFDKTGAVGGGDVNTLFWLFIGFGFINLGFLALFMGLFIVLTLLFHGLRIAFKYKRPVPFYGVILISFIVVSIFAGLLW